MRLGEGLSLLALLGGGERESDIGDRESRARFFRGALLTDELLRRYDPVFGERPRPRGGLPDAERPRALYGERLRELYEALRALPLPLGAGEGDLLPERDLSRKGDAECEPLRRLGERDLELYDAERERERLSEYERDLALREGVREVERPRILRGVLEREREREEYDDPV